MLSLLGTQSTFHLLSWQTDSKFERRIRNWKLLTAWQEHLSVTADGEDHISPDKLNCLSKSSESQYIPSLLWSQVVFQLCATELLIGRGGKEESPRSSRDTWLMPKEVFFLPRIASFCQRWCCLRAGNTFSPSLRPYVWSNLACFLCRSLPWRLICPKLGSPSSIWHICPFALANDFCL